MNHIFALLIAGLILNGCAFVNLDIVKHVKPLQEQTIEGEGNAKILLLDITGFISEIERSGNQLVSEKPSTVAHIKETLQKAENDPKIAGVILRLNSPGGTVTASDIIYHELNGFKSRKNVPLYATITGIGTSGAYYIAAAADYITAHPTAVTGSIGVILPRFNLSGLIAKVGITENAVKSGDKKDILSPFRSSTVEEDQIMQTIITTLHNRFLDVVQTGRGNKIILSELQTLADGRIYTADQALKSKLIDRICYLDETIAAIKEAKGLKEARVVSYYRPGSHIGSIYSGAANDSGSLLSLLNMNSVGFDLLNSSNFLYLWQP